jgi:AAA+ superfamily predicted ATPase
LHNFSTNTFSIFSPIKQLDVERIFIIAPRTPEFVDSVFQDEEEEEIFFGSCSQKERSGAFAKYVPKLPVLWKRKCRECNFSGSGSNIKWNTKS